MPERIMLAVVSMLSTSFCAVPDFRRVEPVRTSGPTTGRIRVKVYVTRKIALTYETTYELKGAPTPVTAR